MGITLLTKYTAMFKSKVDKGKGSVHPLQQRIADPKVNLVITSSVSKYEYLRKNGRSSMQTVHLDKFTKEVRIK